MKWINIYMQMSYQIDPRGCKSSKSYKMSNKTGSEIKILPTNKSPESYHIFSE
jgi:hypothetical protein